MRLMREVRCGWGSTVGRKPTNTWAGTGDAVSLGTPAVLRVIVEGPIDPRTGYLCDIRELDALVRKGVVASLGDLQPKAGEMDARRQMAHAFRDAAANLLAPISLETLEWRVSPFTRLSVDRKDPSMVQLTQSFEFAAAHRLSCPDLSPQENQRLFGKCANPNGHGHNYILEVTVSNSVEGPGFSIAELDRAVRTAVLDPFDHKNLNVECPDFSDLNPTVENIARVIWRRLLDPVRPATLTRVRVWETGKTYAECDGSDF